MFAMYRETFKTSSFIKKALKCIPTDNNPNLQFNGQLLFDVRQTIDVAKENPGIQVSSLVVNETKNNEIHRQNE